MMYNNLNEKTNGLREQVKEKGLEVALEEYLQAILTEMNAETFPNGYNLQQVKESILTTAKSYCDTKEQAETLSDEDVLQMIRDNMKEMDDEQKLHYVANLRLFYQYMNTEKDEYTEAFMKSDYTRFVTYSDEYPVEQKIEDVLAELDLQAAYDFISSLDEKVLVTTSEDEVYEAIQEQEAEKKSEYLNYENAAIQGCVLYGEAVLGNVENITKEVDPGILTAEASAYYDATVTAVQLETNEITEEEAQIQLGWIGKALAVATAVAIRLPVIFAIGKIAKLLTIIITNIGLAPYVAFIVASFVFYYQLRDSIRVLQYDLETMIEKVLLTLKKIGVKGINLVKGKRIKTKSSKATA